MQRRHPVTRSTNDPLTNTFSFVPWLFHSGQDDVIAMVSGALGPDWTVLRETDCEGDVSIIALPAEETGRTPSFILYEKDGQTHVASVRCDQWGLDLIFDSFSKAVDAFIAEALASSVAARPTAN